VEEFNGCFRNLFTDSLHFSPFVAESFFMLTDWIIVPINHRYSLLSRISRRLFVINVAPER
jgi:hypothetical protein